MIHIVLICIAYIVGIIWGLYLDLILGIVFFCLILCLYAILKNYIFVDIRFIFFIVIIFLFGVVYSNVRLENFTSKYIEGEMSTTLKILELNTEKEYYNVYVCRNDLSDKFLVYIPKEYKIKIGETIYVNAIFEKPEVMRNIGGFDYSRYLYSQNIYGILKISSSENIYKKEVSKLNLIYEVQESIYQILGKCFPKDELGIVLGMIIGDISCISEETKNDFKISGITHLLAVSGSNISYIILFSKFVFSKIFGKRISNYFIIFFIIIFMFVSGASPSVVRASIMGIIIVLSDILSRKANIYASVSVSAILILIYNPLTIFDIGFILSFGGTLGIVFLYEKIKSNLTEKLLVQNKILVYMVETFAITVSAQIILLPIMIYNFNSISIISILVNLIVVPFSSVLTILGFVTYMSGLIYFPVAKLLSYVVFLLSKAIINIASFFSNFSYATVLISTPKIIWSVIYYLLIYKIFYNIKNKLFNYILSILLIINIMTEVWPSNHLKVNFLDVGQGDCTYIETRNKRNILIDGGGSKNSDYDVGEKVLLPYILDRGKMKVDLIIVSHIHEDHLEGLLTIIEKLKVNRIVTGPVKEKTKLYEKLISISAEKGILLETVYAGDVITIDDVKIEVLYPSRYDNIDDNENNNSLVLKLTCHDTNILFTGDIEKEVEEKLKKNIKANILKVPHHGSNTSSTDNFIKLINPEISIISLGKNNKLGHPNQDVLKRIEKNNSIIFRTDISGEIMLKIYKNKIKVNTLIN